MLTDQDCDNIAEEVEAELSTAIRISERIPKPALTTLFTDVYSEMPWHIKEEHDEALKGENGE